MKAALVSSAARATTVFDDAAADRGLSRITSVAWGVSLVSISRRVGPATSETWQKVVE